MSFEVKINQDSIDKLQSNVKDAFKKVIANQNMLNELGQTIVTDVVEQTRNEKSIPLGMKDLKLLKEKWITRKQRLKSVNPTDEFYEEGKSNLTFTGQLLRALTWFIKGPGKLHIDFDEKVRTPYMNLNGEAQKEPITNKELAKHIAANGRPFVGVRPVIKRRLQRIVKDYVKRALVVARLSKNNVDN